MASRSALLLVAAPAALLGAASCGSSSQTSPGSGGNGFASTGSHASTNGTGASQGSGTGGSGGSLIQLDGGGVGGGGCQTRCSADLHSVLDCSGNVVTTCPDTQACGSNGACVDPCEAAVANASTIGCEFYSVIPGPESEARGSCFAVLLANTWTVPVSITAERDGQALDIAGMARTLSGSGANLSYVPLANGQLAPGQLALLFLSQKPGSLFYTSCPAGVTPGVSLDPAIDGTGLGSAFHIKTSAPVVAYDIYPYGGAKSYVASATLLIPTAAWGTNYVAADGWAEDPTTGGKPFIQIVAAEDATSVTVNPTADVVEGVNVPGGSAGQPVTYSLAKGQVLQLMQDAELAGSAISSTKPVSLWGGSSCMNIPVGKFACDSGHQQLPPVAALGHEYAAVEHPDRLPGAGETPPWTFVGAVDGTTLTYDPAPPTGAPPTLSSGQVVRFESGAPFSVKSQDADHPFSVLGHMKGWTTLMGTSGFGPGDAETVNTIPPAQWLSRYLFLTDSTYAETHLVVTRRKTAGAFKDVTLDCAGVLAGWTPLGSAGDYEYTYVALVAGGAPQGSCDNGVHTATSDAPFGLTVWGWDDAVSYAYPAGMSTQPINSVVVPTVPK